MTSYLPTPKSKKPKPEKTPKPFVPPQEAGIPVPAAETQPIDVPSKRGMPDWLMGVVVTLVVSILLLAGYVTFSFFRELIGSSGKVWNPFSVSEVSGNTLEPGVTPTLPPLSNPAYKPWNGVDRVTILAMGKDYRENGPESETGPSRTDTMVVLSLDPVTKTAGIISIPRDLYVEIPGYGFNKINAAYFLAEKDRLPGGGPSLAMQTVQELLGIPIDYYAVLDFKSFTTIVDEIGGIDVYVPFDNMVIDPVGPEDVKLLFFGTNHLTGSEALGFARARYTEGGDIDRASRTQQVIFAIRDKVLTLNMLPTLIAKAPALYSEFSSGINTNLTLDQIISLALVAPSVPRKNIRQGIIGNEQFLLEGYITIHNEDVLIPNLEKVRELREKVITDIGPLGYTTPPSDFQALAFEEKAKIQILNGSGQNGFAAATKEYLVKQGFSEANIETGTAESQIPYTQIYDLNGMPYTVRFLSELMNRTSPNLITQVSMDKGVDVQVILGADWSIPQSQ
jgi:LCP family protein required for cell wall assembly